MGALILEDSKMKADKVIIEDGGKAPAPTATADAAANADAALDGQPLVNAGGPQEPPFGLPNGVLAQFAQPVADTPADAADYEDGGAAPKLN
jgi:hypothetical protein